jgi:hypothetical protein
VALPTAPDCCVVAPTTYGAIRSVTHLALRGGCRL